MGKHQEDFEEAANGALGGTAHEWGMSTGRWDIWLQFDERTHFPPLAPAHDVTSASAFKSQPPEQRETAQVKRN